MLVWYLTLPIRLVFSAYYWCRFRIGGATRARMDSIEKDNAQLWQQFFALTARVQVLESKEFDREQAVAIDKVLAKIPEPVRADPFGLDLRVANIEKKIGILKG